MAEPKLWEERLHPEDRDWVIASNDGDIGDDWNIDYRSMRKDGRVVWIHNDARLIRDARRHAPLLAGRRLRHHGAQGRRGAAAGGRGALPHR